MKINGVIALISPPNFSYSRVRPKAIDSVVGLNMATIILKLSFNLLIKVLIQNSSLRSVLLDKKLNFVWYSSILLVRLSLVKAPTGSL